MWEPITKAELDALIVRDLAAASEQQRADYARTAIAPEKWRQSPWGDQGGGFWVVAACGAKVLWYNDVEEGFNVSRFVTRGRIPDDEYWCQQDELGWAIPRLIGEPGGYRLGPPRPLD